eukprot:9420962-Alexandrium_andersonii.AAC.1
MLEPCRKRKSQMLATTVPEIARRVSRKRGNPRCCARAGGPREPFRARVQAGRATFFGASRASEYPRGYC